MNNVISVENQLGNSGFQTYLAKTFGYMTAALMLTAYISYLASHKAFMIKLLYYITEDTVTLKPLSWMIIGTSLLLVLILATSYKNLNSYMAQFCFWLYSGLVGLNLSILTFLSTSVDIGWAFLGSAGLFFCMSIFGFLTKYNLLRLGNILILALLGIIIASITNIFLENTSFQITTVLIGVFVFAVLTAFDIQKMRERYNSLENNSEIYAALGLYLDFINIFSYLIQLPARGRR